MAGMTAISQFMTDLLLRRENEGSTGLPVGSTCSAKIVLGRKQVNRFPKSKNHTPRG
jgi:hypothetical protein